MSAPGARTNAQAGTMDFWLLAATLVLTGVGLMMVLSASGIMAEKFYNDKYFFFRKQALFCGLGICLMGGLAAMPLKRIYSLKYVFLGMAFVMLLLALASPLGVTVNGAKRWIRIGVFSIQPLEFAKAALVLYLGWFLSCKQELVKKFSVGVIPPFAVTGLLCLLTLLQPDFGGAVILAGLLFLMCLVGGTRLTFLGASMGMAVAAGWLLIINSPYRTRRLLAFLDPFKDALDSGYQLVQSLYAFGSGSVWGEGLGAGKQKLFFLPEAHNDFIVAVIGEELGFVGVTLVFALMGFLLFRGFRLAWLQEELRDRFTAYGMTLVIGLGAVLNMAVVLGAAPPKGVPMPFLSYGGSSLVMSFACVGVLLNLSKPRPARQGGVRP